MANPSHKRETNARRKPKAALVAAPIAAAVTLGTVGFGVVSSVPTDGVGVLTAQNSFAEIIAQREQTVSRSAARGSVDLEEGHAADDVSTAAEQKLARKQARK